MAGGERGGVDVRVVVLGGLGVHRGESRTGASRGVLGALDVVLTVVVPTLPSVLCVRCSSY